MTRVSSSSDYPWTDLVQGSGRQRSTVSPQPLQLEILGKGEFLRSSVEPSFYSSLVKETLSRQRPNPLRLYPRTLLR